MAAKYTRHPSQRLPSPARSLSAIVHTIGIIAFSASFRYLRTFPAPIGDQYGGHFQYLTIIGLGLALVSMSSGLIADISGSSTFFNIKNIVSVCAAPLEVLISLLYWGIRTYDKSLLFPAEFQLPFLPDFGFHAMPAVMLTIDVLLFSPPWTIKGYGALLLSTVLAFSYWGWVEYCFTHNQVYPYPLFELLSTTQRVILFTFSGALNASSMLGLKWLYGQINGVDQLKREAKLE